MGNILPIFSDEEDESLRRRSTYCRDDYDFVFTENESAKIGKDSINAIERSIKSGDDQALDWALGSILGAFIGDSAGAVLEFIGRQITDDDVKEALEFNGGGYFNVDKGQITDDSEMALAMMRGLINSEESFVDQKKIAQEYVNWYDSNPFDIGMATTSALKEIKIALNSEDRSNTFMLWIYSNF